jgi:hypothetical protein
MSGVAVIRYLLAHDAPVLAAVPATRIFSGDLPLNTAMPAISVMHISGVPYNMLQPNESGKVHTDRVQVTVYRGESPGDAGYPGVKSLLTLVLAACPSQRGTVNGVAVQSIIPDIEGPDLPIQELSLYSRSRDFLVMWTA